MKKIILLFCLSLACANAVFAQDNTETNGLKAAGHKGLDFSVELGYGFPTKGDGGITTVDLGLGKRFTKNFYWGIGTGLYLPTKGGKPMIPLFTDLKAYFPINGTAIVPDITARLGYVLNTEDDITVKIGKQTQTYESPNYTMLQVIPGIQLPLSLKADFNLGVGYTHMFPSGGGNGSGYFTVKLGFNFHKPIFKITPIPTLDRGMQFTFEGGSASPWKLSDVEKGYGSANLTAAITYKWNPNISFGIGYSLNYFLMHMDAYSKDSYAGNNELEGFAHDFFVRGQYRLTDNKISPIIACDLGWRNFSYSDDEWKSRDEEGNDGPKKSGLFVAPAVGMSLRTANNTYLEIKLGYDFMGKTSEYADEHFTYGTTSLSAPFFKIGFTHTFSLGKDWGK